MADFCQTGVSATLHRMKAFDEEQIEGGLKSFSRDYKIAQVLPRAFDLIIENVEEDNPKSVAAIA